MPIKLNGATSGSVELDVPATVSGGDITLTLPPTDGSADQVLKTDGNGTLDWIKGNTLLQIATDTDETYISSNSTTYVSCGPSVAINILKANSKCLVHAHVNMNTNVSAGRGRLRLRRTVGSTTTTIADAAEALVNYGNNGSHVQGIGFNFLDTHGNGTAGTAVTYELEFSCNNTNGPISVNNNGISIITVMEIDA